ncbi:MAG: 7TM-DISM domain-containing protein, partial [Chitinophagales bacterium]
MSFLLMRTKSCLLCFLILLATTSLTYADPKAEAGFLDLRAVDLNNARIPLQGDWYYFANQLISPSEIASSGKAFAYFPKIWNENANAESGSGFATYALYILVSKETTSLALEIPQLYSSYSLYANNNLVAVNGKVGTSKESTSPQWMPQTVSFENTGDTLKLVLQIANFHHYKGGAKDPIYLGSARVLQQKRSMAVIANLIESIALGVISIAFLCIYFFWAQKKVIIYFALLCLTWAVRVGFSNLYIFISFWPDFNWTIMVRIEYMTLFLTMIWGILFLRRVFPKEQNTIFTYLLVLSNIVFLAYAIFATPVAFTHWLTVYLAFCGILLMYAIFVVLWGWINQRTGANFLAASILLGTAIFGYDVFSYKGYFYYNPIIFSVG